MEPNQASTQSIPRNSWTLMPTILSMVFVIIAGILFYIYHRNSNFQPPVPSLNQTNNHVVNNCFPDIKSEASLDTTNWQNFEGYGFALKYPSDSISIKSVGNPYVDKEFGYELMSANGYGAQIKIHKILNEGFYGGGRKSLLDIVYEPHSNAWWNTQVNKGWPYPTSPCFANEFGRTNSDYPIYITTWGDVGMFDTVYLILIRNVPDEYGHYQPLLIEIDTGGDGADPTYVNYPKFKNILDNILKTIDVRPTSEG